MRTSLPIPVLGWILSTGCTAEDLPDIRYETDHLRIGTYFEEELCAGNLAELDAHVVYVSERLGVDVQDPIEMYLLGEEEEPPDCPGAAGCTDAKARRVFARWWVARHELGHAVAWDLEGDVLADEFIEEGFAEAFAGVRTEFGWQSPSLTVGAPSVTDVDYSSAAHFVRWLHTRDGGDNLRELLQRSSERRNRRHAERAFEKAYGTSLSDLEDEYWANAPDLIPGDEFCDFPALGGIVEGFEVEATLDCAEEHTRGTDHLERSYTFEVAGAGRYIFELDGPGDLMLWYCYEEPLGPGDSRPTILPPVRGQFRAEMREPRREEWWSGPGEIFLDAGRYRIDLRVTDTAPTQLVLRGHPRIGATQYP